MTQNSTTTSKNNSLLGATYYNWERTYRKICDIARDQPDIGDWLFRFFGFETMKGNVDYQIFDQQNQRFIENAFNPYIFNLLRTTFAPEMQALGEGGDGMSNNTTSSFAQKTNDFLNQTQSKIQQIKQKIQEVAQPVSNFLGTTLSTISGICKDPIGGFSQLPRSIHKVIQTISPSLASQYEQMMQKTKILNWCQLPSMSFGGLKMLILSINKIFSTPFMYLSDLYNGLRQLLRKLADMIDNILQNIWDFIFGPDGLIDSILPFNEILSLLRDLQWFISEVMNILSLFGANVSFGNMFGQISQWTQFLDVRSFLANTVSPYFSMAQNYLNYLYYPEQLLSQMLPSSIKQLLSRITQIPGLGFTGLMCYDIGSIFEKLEKNMISTILSEYRYARPLLDLFCEPDFMSQSIPRTEIISYDVIPFQTKPFPYSSYSF